MCSYRYAVPFEELWTRSKQVQVNDSVLRVMSLALLLRVKRISARPHDLIDVDGLLALEKTQSANARPLK